MPPGYEDGSQWVQKLIQVLYRLKQAGNVWNMKLNEALTELTAKIQLLLLYTRIWRWDLNIYKFL